MLKRNIQINFRVNAEEQLLLLQNAKKCKLSIAKYLRSLIHGYVPKEQPPVDYKTLIRELHAIGNNMNQIAARANTTGFIAADAYKKNVSDLQNTILEIQKAVTLPEKLYRVKYNVYENGVRLQRSKSFPTAKEAKEFASKVEYELDTGQYSYTKGRTLADILNEWLEVYCTHLRPNALADMKKAVKVHLIPHLGNVPLESVTTGMIQKLYNDMMKTEWKPAVFKEVNGMKVEVSPAKTYSAKTVHNVHSALKQALDQAVRTNLISRNPCAYVRLPKKESIDYVIPSPEQLSALLNELGDHPTYYPILICAMLGCRRGEALGLQWQDIDFKQNSIRIRRAYIYNSLTQKNEIGELKTKNSKRVLPMPEMLKTELLKLKERNKQICEELGIEIPYLCINDAGQMLTPNLCSHHFQQAAKKVGLQGMRLHDLRHTVVTYMLDAGENPKTVQEFVGHADPGFMLRQHAHVLEQSKKRASDALMRNLFGQNV